MTYEDAVLTQAEYQFLVGQKTDKGGVILSLDIIPLNDPAILNSKEYILAVYCEPDNIPTWLDFTLFSDRNL